MLFHNTGFKINEEPIKEIMKLIERENICIKNVFVTVENCELKEKVERFCMCSILLEII